MEKYCKRCGNDVEGDSDGRGHIVFWCEECDCEVGDRTEEEARDDDGCDRCHSERNGD